MEQFHESGVLTKLLVSYSRDEQEATSPRYVQDNMRLHGAELCDLVTLEGAHVYVCGDAHRMAANVNETWMDILQKNKGYYIFST